MSLPEGATRALGRVFGTFIPIAFLFVGGYWFYHAQRTEILVKRNQREVATLRDAIRRRFDAITLVFATDVRSRETTPLAPDRYPDLRPVKGRVELTLPPASTYGTRVGIVAEDARATVYVSYEAACDHEHPDFNKPDFNKAEGLDCDARAAACVEEEGRSRKCSRIPLAKLLDTVLQDGAFFDGIVLTVGTVPVAIEGDLVPVGIEDDLRRELEHTPAAAEGATSSPNEEIGKIMKFLGAPPAPQVRLRDVAFSDFADSIAPGQIREGSACKPDGKREKTEKACYPDGALRIHGLLRTRTLNAEARQIPNAWLLALIFLLVLALASWPVLKIWSMGPHERLNGLDVRLLVLSLLLGVGLVSFILLDFAGDQKLAARFDGQLEELAARLSTQLATDVVSAGSAIAHPPKEGDELDYGDFTQIVLIDANGQPETRWLPKADGDRWRLEKENSPKLNVKERTYYTDLQAGHVWWVPRTPTFSVSSELVTSKTNGLLTLVIARWAEPASKKVLLIALKMSALLEPLLPHGFGFAFVDERGDVKLHSDTRRNLVENIVTECGDDSRLAAAIAMAAHRGTPPPLDVMYRGVPHRFVLRSLSDMPWRLIVFRDRRITDRVNNEIVAAWAALYLTYVGGCLILLLLMQMMHDGYRADWLWPDRRHPRLYWPAAFRLLGTAGVAAAALARQPDGWRLAMLVAVAAGTLAALCRALGNPRRRVLARPERRLARWTAWGAVALAIVLAMRSDDWATALAVVALAAAWEPALTWRPSQVLAVVVAVAVIVLDWRAVPLGWLALLVVLTAPGWLPRRLVPWRAAADRVLASLGRRWPRRARVRALVGPKEWTFRCAYVSMLVGLLAVVSVVPTVSMYFDARRQVRAELAKFYRVDFAREMAWRKAQPAETQGAAPSAVFETSIVSEDWSQLDGTVPGPLHALEDFLFLRMPTFGPPIPELRALASDDPPSARDGGPSVVSVSTRGEAAKGMTVSTVGASASGDRPMPWVLVVVVVLWVFLGAIVFGIVWSIVRLLFLLDVDRVDATGPMHPTRGSFIVWTLAPGQRIALVEEASAQQDLLDLREPTTADALAKKADAIKAPTLEVDHLECALVDPPLHTAVLDLLEKLVRGHKKAVILTSEVDPLRYVGARVLEAQGDQAVAATPEAAKEKKAAADAAGALLDRWSRLLDAFRRVRWEVPPGARLPADEKAVAEMLLRKFPKLPDCDKVPADEADEACEARHWQLWGQCTRAEKLALRHLAEEGFLNPNARDIVRPLMRRLLVRRDPAFCLPTEAFRRFVMRAETCATVGEWERTGVRSAWARLRTPLVTLGGLGTAYLLLAEPDALNWTIALTTGVAAGLPALMRMFAMVGDQRTGAGAR